jgi:hypothetical protein
MSKKVLFALVIMAVSVLVLIFNRGTVQIDLLLGTVRALKSIAFLAFIAVGVVIGILLK